MPAARVEVQDAFAALSYCYEQGWAADGLPVVPPAENLVSACLDSAGRSPDEVVVAMPPIRRVCTIEQAAANAVMAGCLPEYFPVVLAALEALGDARYALHASAASTGGSGPLLIVNGPIRGAIGLNSGANVFGPGCRANATIGRAIRLVILNVFGMAPGVFDLSTQGFPGKYSLCIAENEEASPWEPLHVEKGFQPDESTVTVWPARSTESLDQRLANTPEAVLLAIADTMSRLGALHSHAQAAVVLGPEHADVLARAGWSKAQVRRFLHAHARRPEADLERIQRPPGDELGMSGTPVGGFSYHGQTPEDILLVVAGARNAGVSTVLQSWGHRQSPGVGLAPAPDRNSIDHVTRVVRPARASQ